MRRVPGPVVLLILDGIASNEPYDGNAVAKARTPFLESIWETYPHGLLHASAEHVGLPTNVKGNSEVGHTNIGAGQVVYQYLPRINTAIAKGIFYTNTGIKKVIDQTKVKGSALHILGCISDGNVHSALNHFLAILEFCARAGQRNVYFHLFTDGRDTEPKSASRYIEQLELWMGQYKIGKIATIIGRQYAMDRNKTWARTARAYELVTQHKGTPVASWTEALAKSYAAEITDEFLEPYVIQDADVAQKGKIQNGDGVIFLNFRPDRAVQLTQALLQQDGFTGFSRGVVRNDLSFVGMVRYDKDLPMEVAFPPTDVKMPLGRIVSMAGMRQLRLTESQKFPHVTYFVNGGINTVFPGEMRICIPSPEVPTFDKKPEMSIYEITDTFKRTLDYGIYDLFIVNFANGDMVGHSGVFEAGVKAVEHVDTCTAQIVKQVLSRNGAVFVTADHGNVDEMTNQLTGEIDTEHSVFPVPFVGVYKGAKNNYQFPLGSLQDIAPTVLDFLGLEVPPDMTGRVLIDK
ncbi:MAG: 2,3-bisphosphoglycerate-independent phosphoglycerate mutase [Candidatus Dojkabacteria bacterium]|nr:MAG: 2,3-bisphosphoglycerate-independent phosphoglycerate mutase [Candidatus Dojkabacteria bacterium]